MAAASGPAFVAFAGSRRRAGRASPNSSPLSAPSTARSSAWKASVSPSPASFLEYLLWTPAPARGRDNVRRANASASPPSSRSSQPLSACPVASCFRGSGQLALPRARARPGRRRRSPLGAPPSVALPPRSPSAKALRACSSARLQTTVVPGAPAGAGAPRKRELSSVACGSARLARPTSGPAHARRARCPCRATRSTSRRARAGRRRWRAGARLELFLFRWRRSLRARRYTSALQVGGVHAGFGGRRAARLEIERRRDGLPVLLGSRQRLRSCRPTSGSERAIELASVATSRARPISPAPSAQISLATSNERALATGSVAAWASASSHSARSIQRSESSAKCAAAGRSSWPHRRRRAPRSGGGGVCESGACGGSLGIRVASYRLSAASAPKARPRSSSAAATSTRASVEVPSRSSMPSLVPSSKLKIRQTADARGRQALDHVVVELKLFQRLGAGLDVGLLDARRGPRGLHARRRLLRSALEQAVDVVQRRHALHARDLVVFAKRGQLARLRNRRGVRHWRAVRRRKARLARRRSGCGLTTGGWAVPVPLERPRGLASVRAKRGAGPTKTPPGRGTPAGRGGENAGRRRQHRDHRRRADRRRRSHHGAGASRQACRRGPSFRRAPVDPCTAAASMFPTQVGSSSGNSRASGACSLRPSERRRRLARLDDAGRGLFWTGAGPAGASSDSSEIEQRVRLEVGDPRPAPYRYCRRSRCVLRRARFSPSSVLLIALPSRAARAGPNTSVKARTAASGRRARGLRGPRQPARAFAHPIPTTRHRRRSRPCDPSSTSRPAPSPCKSGDSSATARALSRARPCLRSCREPQPEASLVSKRWNSPSMAKLGALSSIAAEPTSRDDQRRHVIGLAVAEHGRAAAQRVQLARQRPGDGSATAAPSRSRR